MKIYKSEIVKYMSNGILKRYKVSVNNPRDFKEGDKYIVIGSSECVKTVTSIENAEKLNNSIISGDLIRRVFE